MKKKDAAMNEAAYDEPAAPDAEAIAKRKRLQAIKDRQEEQLDHAHCYAWWYVDGLHSNLHR